MLKPLLNQSGGALNHLLQEAQLFQALLSVGQAQLPPELQAHLIGVGFEQSTLILQIDESIWATQLRFFEDTVLNVYKTHFPHLALTRVKIHIFPKSQTPIKVPKTSSFPSDTDAQTMQLIARNTDSQGLKMALLKLSQRAQPATDKTKHAP
ncbi:DciA family protein [Thiomicrorhabdus aquaedulcis]|uniref:DciA family protein n=1 Tax=Thiomicrorhabdus aquaedulcis TaxID=2211106 RepID=UPI000FD9D98B|nr:DciA family protein [Thiomicrorhabdus aquaedulcis]